MKLYEVHFYEVQQPVHEYKLAFSCWYKYITYVCVYVTNKNLRILYTYNA